MSADELKGYGRWFLETVPARIAELHGAINSSPGFEDWEPDHSFSSIEALGLWLSRQVETRPRTNDEIDRIKVQSNFDVGVSGEELTNRTFSLAMDAGMYFGESLVSGYPHLQYYQPLNDKKFADFGQMVLLGFGRATLNPVRIVVTFCYGVASGKQGSKRLGEVYNYWLQLARGTAEAAKSK